MRKNRSDSAIGRNDSSATRASNAMSGATREMRTGFSAILTTVLRRAALMSVAAALVLCGVPPRSAAACTTFMTHLVGDLLTLVVLPLPLITAALLYLDVRKRRDNFGDDDLRAMLASLRS